MASAVASSRNAARRKKTQRHGKLFAGQDTRLRELDAETDAARDEVRRMLAE